MVVNVIHELTLLGLTEYEAKAYTALLRSGRVLSAYEISKESHIPSSKIYEVIGKLCDREIVQPVDNGDTKRYTALDPSEFIAHHRFKMESSLGRLSKGLSSLKRDAYKSTIWNMSEYDILIDKASRMICEARRELLISVWKEEFAPLYPHAAKAAKRNVKTAVIHFGKAEHTAGQLFEHPIADTLFSEKGGRGIVVVADAREALIGTVYEDGSVDGGISENSGFVTLAEDYVKHDIYIMKIVNRYDAETYTQIR